MSKLNQETTLDKQNSPAIADEKAIKPNMPETAVPDTAGDRARNPLETPIPFNDAICHLEEWGLSTSGDLNTNFNLADFSLDPLLQRFNLWKKNLEEQIKSMVVMKLPDAVRPVALVIRIAEYLEFIIKLVQCAISLIKQILKLIRKISDAVSTLINKLTAYVARQTAILKQLQKKVMMTPSWFLLTMMKQLNKNLLNYTNGPSDLLKDITTLTKDIHNLQTVIKQTPNFIENEMKRIRSNMKRMCDSVKNAANKLDALDWTIKQPDLIGAFTQIATPQEKWLLQKLMQVTGPDPSFNIYSNNRYLGANADGYLSESAGGPTGTDSTTQSMASNTLVNTSNSLQQTSAACSNSQDLLPSDNAKILSLRSVLGSCSAELDKIATPAFESPITLLEVNEVRKPLNNLLMDLEKLLQDPDTNVKNLSAKIALIGALTKALSERINLFLTHDPLPTGTNYNNMISGGDTGTDTMTTELSSDQLVEIKKIAQLLSDEIANNITNNDLLRSQADDVFSQSNILLARVERIQDLQDSITSGQQQLQVLETKREELAQTYKEYEAQQNQTVDTRLLGYSSSAFSFTLTNNQDEFIDLDGVTNYSLYRQMTTALDNTWTDIFSSNEPGILMMGTDRFGAFELATDTKIQASNCGLELRLLIDNGLWILEAYSDGSSSTSDVVDGSKLYHFGKFTTVPTAPHPDMLRVVTGDEFAVAYNNPLAAKNGTNREEIVLAVPDGTDLNKYITHTDDTDYLAGLNGSPWMRYYSQREIDDLEQLYTTALQSLNLSIQYPVDNELDQKSQNIWMRKDGTYITRSYAFPTDTQITDLLLNKKPYQGMKIPANALSLQFAKIAPQGDSISDLDKTTCPFGITARWGFISSNK